MATNKCHLVGGEEKEVRKCTEKLRKQAMGLHFNEFMYSFLSLCQMDYFIYFGLYAPLCEAE